MAGELLAKLETRVKDERLHSNDKQAAIDAALLTFSRYIPEESVVDVPGNGSSIYELPPGWAVEFSRILSVIYPLDEARGRYPKLPPDRYTVTRTPAGERLRFVGLSPKADETFRLGFTIPWSETTLPSVYREAAADLAAAYACDTLATQYAQTTDATIGADAVNYRTKSDEYRALSRHFRERYEFQLPGLPQGEATGGYGDWDLTYAWGGDMLTHPRRWR